jgi:hypothetical protein
MAGHHWLTPVIYVLGRLRSRESWFEASLGKYFSRPHLQNNQSKMDWSCGSSKAPALQVQSPEFKPRSHKKTKKLDTVGHTRNPSYVGGGDQEDSGSRSTWAKRPSSQ